MKKPIAILLTLLLILTLAGCQTASENPGTPETSVESPTVGPVRLFTEPDEFTRQMLADKDALGGEGIVDVKLANGRAYVLTDAKMRVYQDAVLFTEWDITYDAPGLSAVRCDIEDGTVYILCMDALQDVYVLTYDTDGTFRQAHLAMHKEILLGRAPRLTVHSGSGYISISTSDSSALYRYNFANDTVEKTDLPYTVLAPYKDGKLLALRDRMLVDVFDPQTGESELLIDSSKDMFITALAYHAASDTLYFRGQEKESANNNAESAKPNFLYRYPLGAVFSNAREKLETADYTDDTSYTIAYSIAQNTLLAVENGEAVLYSPIHGAWGGEETSTDDLLSLLPVTDMDESYDDSMRRQFRRWESPARRWLESHSDAALSTISIVSPHRIPWEALRGHSFFSAEPLVDENADMYLFDGGISAFIPPELPLLDLSQYPGINDKMDAMLPGIKELCMRDGRLIGIPLRFHLCIEFVKEPEGFVADMLPLNLSLGEYVHYLQNETNQTAVLPHKGLRGYDISDLFDNMIFDAQANHIPSVEELAVFLSDFKAYAALDLSSRKMVEMTNILPLTHDRALEAGRIIRPRLVHVSDAKLPVFVTILSVSADSDRIDEILPLLETICDKEFQLDTNTGDGAREVWYADEELYQEHSFYQNFEDIIAQSCMVAEHDKRGLYVLRGIAEDYRTGEMDLQTAANEMLRILLLLQDDPFSPEVKQLYEADKNRLYSLLDMGYTFH